MKYEPEPYPVTIRPSRYGGSYEGGGWFAVNSYEVPEDAEAGDLEAMRFWESTAADRIGRGDSPNEAYADLKRRLKGE